MLQPGELDQLRADMAAVLSDTCVVLRAATVPDGGGGLTETWSQVAVLACRIVGTARQLSGETSHRIGDRVDARTTHVVSLPSGSDVTAEDRLEISGVTYEVTAVHDRSDGLLLRAEARLLAV